MGNAGVYAGFVKRHRGGRVCGAANTMRLSSDNLSGFSYYFAGLKNRVGIRQNKNYNIRNCLRSQSLLHYNKFIGCTFAYQHSAVSDT